MHLGLAVEALAQHLPLRSQNRLVVRVDDVGLNVHHQLRPAAGLLHVHMVHLGRPGALLRGEGEHPGPFNLCLPEKDTQLFQLRLALAGQAGDEAGPQHQAGDAGPELCQQVQQLRLGIPAVHGLQDPVVAVLDGDVQILDDLGLLRNGVDQLLSDLVRIQIVEPDPVEVQPAQLPQERRQLVLAVQVRSIPGDILGDDQQLLHAGVR